MLARCEDSKSTCFPSCWDFGRENTEQGPLSRTQPIAKGNPNLACFLFVLDDQTIPSRLNRKLPESLYSHSRPRASQTMDTLTPEQYNHHQLTGLYNSGVFDRQYAYFLSWVEAPGRRQWPRSILVKSHSQDCLGLHRGLE